MRFEKSKPVEYQRVLKESPIAYLPWGAHEWHGRHNPLGLDSLKAHGQCLALCAETGGIVFPPIYCGTDTMKPHAAFPCTLNFTEDCVRLLAYEYLQQLADEGFKVVVIVMGHYGGRHVAAIRKESEQFNGSQRACVCWAFPDYEPTADDGFPAEHAACYETSYMMHLQPELVDLTRLPATGDLDFTLEGIGGEDPRGSASADKGRAGIESLVRNAAPRILEMLREKREPASDGSENT